MSNTHERIDDGDAFSENDDKTSTTSITSHIETPLHFRRLLRNRAGTVRTIWRMLLYILIAGILTLTVQGVSRFFFESPGGKQEIDSVRSIIGFFISDALLIFAAGIMLKAIDRRPFTLYGLGFHRGWLVEFAGGMAWGVILLLAVFVLLLLSSSGTVVMSGIDPPVRAGIGRMFLVFLGAAALEELVMRGYLFQAFVEGTTPIIGVVAFSGLFGLGHTSNEHWGLIGFLNTSLAGVLLSVLYLKTRSLWLPIGVHTTWNWTQGSILGIPVSGIDIDESIVTFSPSGSTVLNGGEFGAEGSIFATAILTAAIIWAIFNHRLRPSERLVQLWRETKSDMVRVKSYHEPPSD